MGQFTTAKKACKCWLCKAPINVGDKAQWHEHKSTGHGEWSGKAYTRTYWELQCVDGCGDRLYAKEQEAQSAKEQQDAQFCIDSLRNINMSQDHINSMIEYYAQKGVIVK